MTAPERSSSRSRFAAPAAVVVHVFSLSLAVHGRRLGRVRGPETRTRHSCLTFDLGQRRVPGVLDVVPREPTRDEFAPEVATVFHSHPRDHSTVAVPVIDDQRDGTPEHQTCDLNDILAG